MSTIEPRTGPVDVDEIDPIIDLCRPLLKRAKQANQIGVCEAILATELAALKITSKVLETDTAGPVEKPTSARASRVARNGGDQTGLLQTPE